MNTISLIFFVITFLIIGTMLKKGVDVLSPSRVFCLTWSMVFGLANLKLSKLQFDWTPLQWATVLIGPVFFLLGLFICYVLNLNSRLLPVNEIRQRLRIQRINDTKLFYLIVVVFIFYALGYFVVYLTQGQVPIFSRNPATARTEFSTFGVGLFLHNVPIVIYFAIIFHLLTRDNDGRKFVLKMISFTVIITYLFLLQRYSLMMVSIIIFSALYYITKAVRLKTVILFTVIGALVIYSVATLRSGKIVQLALYKTSQMKFSLDYAIFTEPYMYIVMNVENFVHSVSKLEQYTFGYFTFNYALALTGLKHWLEGYFGIIETPYLFSGYNTYTLFWTFYRDFGIFGISIIPLGLGLFVGHVYYSLRRNPTIRLVTFYSIMVFVMVMSFFINMLGFLWFAYIIMWFVIILKLIRPVYPRPE